MDTVDKEEVVLEEEQKIEEMDPAVKKMIRRERMKDLLSTLAIVFITFAMFRFVLTMHKVPSSSMEPTIRTDSIAICWRLPFLIGNPQPNRGDIVSFKDPDSDVFLIKRVIGVGGDTVSFDGKGNVYLNGSKLDEPYVKTPEASFADKEEYKVPEGTMFVMGDNRMNSKDSRWKPTAFIPVENIHAKELFSFYAPFFMVEKWD